MQNRPLGNSGEKISAVSVGCWAAGGVGWGGTDDRKTSDAFARALDLEINLFDTAPVYGFGHSERVLGRALESRRDEALIATKFGLIWEREEADSITNDLRPQSIKAACEQSLKDLRTDRIDLYQCHWPLPGDAMTRTVCEDMIAALLDLRDSGKVRFFGVSNFSIEQIELCGGAEAIASVQPPLSILRPALADSLIAYCQQRGIGVICYSPLQRGLLSGRFKGDETFPEDDTRGADPNYQGERFRAICGRVADLRPFAEAHESTIASVSLNWVLSAPGVTSAIAGVRSEAQIEEVAGARGWSLSPDERAEIAEMFAEFTKPPAAS